MKKKIFSLLLIFSIVLTSFGTVYAQNDDTKLTIEILENGVFLDDTYYTKEEFLKKLDDSKEIESNEIEVRSTGTLIAGTWWIPGIGKVVITVAGVIIVGGAVIKAGSWLYDSITSYFSTKKELETAKKRIPNRLKKSSDTVDLNKFNRHVRGRSTKWKEPGGWTIEKDYSGHKGSAWKLKNKSDEREASLDANGRIVGK